ncbi:MAG: hypothetical protein IJA42_06810, partial [Bacteroidales bacterium]|nr:hypothetical protein [Bacteroidales bacterium]
VVFLPCKVVWENTEALRARMIFPRHPQGLTLLEQRTRTTFACGLVNSGYEKHLYTFADSLNCYNFVQ